MTTPTLPFDPDDAPPGYIALPYDAAGGCRNCSFANDEQCSVVPCMVSQRDDCQPAIFKLRASQTYLAKPRGCDSCIFSPTSACRNCPYYKEYHL
jgi:hypothetical protein